jgi:hypothetical protein
METTEHVFHLDDKISTDYSGYNQLSKFYHYCLTVDHNSTINIDFSNVSFFDGNLSALLLAIVYYLKKNYNHTFTTDANVIKERFEVLLRNGFINTGEPVSDNRKSTVPIHAFDCNDKEGFYNYIETELLLHRGIPSSLINSLRDRIIEDLLEIFCNTNHHANTQDPFFVGGQFYPTKGLLKFTMVDLGSGFLPRIHQVTRGRVSTNLDSILWALEGNSSKTVLDNCPGGLGLKGIYNYCKNNKGTLQIISNNGFWSSEYENTIFERGRTLQTPFLGTTINLFFKKD